MTVALRLQRAGHHNFTIYERDPELGGTWQVNDYPGAACDIPSHLYSISFEPKADWSRRYPRQAEIIDYQRRIYDRRGLHAHLELDTDITELRFDEAHRSGSSRPATATISKPMWSWRVWACSTSPTSPRSTDSTTSPVRSGTHSSGTTTTT